MHGQLAKLVVYVDLGKPLISKVIIEGRTQRVEYESLPIVCFGCGWWGHTRDNCPFNQEHENTLDMERGRKHKHSSEPQK